MLAPVRDLFDQASPWRPAGETAALLKRHHYLGPTRLGAAYQDEFGVMVVASPTSRRLPPTWLELTRWCLLGRGDNAGSRQWSRFLKALRRAAPEATTLISYSDPSVGHGGGLYRACSWWWAPTWHRLRPPPTGQGSWNGEDLESVKDRWVFPLDADRDRVAILTIQDDAILRRYPWARYREPGGADHKAFRALLAGQS